MDLPWTGWLFVFPGSRITTCVETSFAPLPSLESHLVQGTFRLAEGLLFEEKTMARPKFPRPACKTCGATVDRPPSGYANFARAYCSIECASNSKSDELRCPVCKEAFRRPPSHRSPSETYCSRACADKSHGAKVSGERSGAWRGGKITVECEECGLALQRFPSRVVPGRRMFCDLKCRSAFRSKHESGENSPLWKERSVSWMGGGANRSRRQQTYWARGVKRRAGDKCEHCGAKGRKAKLRAHHIFGYAAYPALRLEPENGICLCVRCHLKTHRGKLVPQRRVAI